MHDLEDEFRIAYKSGDPRWKTLWRAHQKIRKEYIIKGAEMDEKIASKRAHYVIAEDLRIISEDEKFIQKYPSSASDAADARETYLEDAEEIR